ncbi:unnamed protein product, partial [Didymodactylos carnosus]
MEGYSKASTTKVHSESSKAWLSSTTRWDPSTATWKDTPKHG